MTYEQRHAAGRRPAPPFEICRATPADAEGVSGLLSASYKALLQADYTPNVLAAALPVISKARPDLLASRSYFIAKAGGGCIIAVGGWSWLGPVGGAAPLDMGHMRHVAVAPDVARQGIGALLLDHILNDARTAGVRIMSCLSTLSAEAFYAKAGFTRRGDVALSLAPGLDFPAIDMRRVL